MNIERSQNIYRWLWLSCRVAIGVAAAFALLIGYAVWDYTSWRNRMIQWDYVRINHMYGGETEEDRLIDFRFVRQWEYTFLKRTSDGKQVRMHCTLSKRSGCSNLLLSDRSHIHLIRHTQLRFPNGVPELPQAAYEGRPFGAGFLSLLLGYWVDESEEWNREYGHRVR